MKSEAFSSSNVFRILIVDDRCITYIPVLPRVTLFQFGVPWVFDWGLKKWLKLSNNEKLYDELLAALRYIDQKNVINSEVQTPSFKITVKNTVRPEGDLLDSVNIHRRHVQLLPKKRSLIEHIFGLAHRVYFFINGKGNEEDNLTPTTHRIE